MESDIKLDTDRIIAEGNVILFKDDAGGVIFSLYMEDGNFFLGNKKKAGQIYVRDNAGRDAIHLEADSASLQLGASGNPGNIVLGNGSGFDAIHLTNGRLNLTSNIEFLTPGIIVPGKWQAGSRWFELTIDAKSIKLEKYTRMRKIVPGMDQDGLLAFSEKVEEKTEKVVEFDLLKEMQELRAEVKALKAKIDAQ